MTLQIETVPCLSDNYAYLAHDPETDETAVIDVPEAAPILAKLAEKGWRADHVLITHHHADHVQGLDGILAEHKARVVGHAADAHRLPPLDVALQEGDSVEIGAEEGRVLDVSGHTIGHIAYHFPASKVMFTADSLMALGCGRVFEGTMPQMWASLQKMAVLDPDTLICSGHEYTAANAKFAVTIDPFNPDLVARAEAVMDATAKGIPTVPTRLSEELATNPFLRAENTAVQKQLGMTDADPAEVFAEIRRRKDNF